jgi:hypothetical protein
MEQHRNKGEPMKKATRKLLVHHETLRALGVLGDKPRNVSSEA